MPKLSEDLSAIYRLEIARGNQVVAECAPAGTNCPYAVVFRDPLHKAHIERELQLPPWVRYWESRDPHYAIEAGYFSDRSKHSISGPLPSS